MRRFVLIVSALALGGCAVGPNYRRPKVDVPAQLRDAPATPDH